MHDITMRFSDAEKEKLQRYAKLNGITVEAAIKKALLDVVQDSEQSRSKKVFRPFRFLKWRAK